MVRNIVELHGALSIIRYIYICYILYFRSFFCKFLLSGKVHLKPQHMNGFANMFQSGRLDARVLQGFVQYAVFSKGLV